MNMKVNFPFGKRGSGLRWPVVSRRSQIFRFIEQVERECRRLLVAVKRCCIVGAVRCWGENVDAMYLLSNFEKEVSDGKECLDTD